MLWTMTVWRLLIIQVGVGTCARARSGARGCCALELLQSGWFLMDGTFEVTNVSWISYMGIGVCEWVGSHLVCRSKLLPFCLGCGRSYRCYDRVCDLNFKCWGSFMFWCKRGVLGLFFLMQIYGLDLSTTFKDIWFLRIKALVNVY